MPLNKKFIGREYPPLDATVTLEALQNYARAYNDDNPRYFDPSIEGAIVAPPMFGVALTWMSVVGAVGDPALGADLLRLLHAEQDMEFLAPLRPGDEIITIARVASIEARPGGEAMALELNSRNRAGAPVLRTLFGIFIRAARRDRSAAGRAERPVSPAGDPILSVEQAIDRDQTFRYAEASGDRNPIHVDENVAKMAGLPGIIVHGLCTMAFTSKVMIDGLCAGDPVRLKRLRVQFSRPVFPGQSITTKVWSDGERAGRRTYAFETYNPERMAVIRGGIAEVAP
ncbi:MAG TPA: MaoC/PaaZ C-terminal domain-containing protein [Candidatus Binataceae bacterium]|jgi:acyl dehydratase|nr:MaoC/PaaZ C-terminal domain-containing protein [Candidatus Binataceae bacterium]